MKEENLPKLPKGWVWTRVGEIITFEYGKGLRKDKRDSNGNVPVYGSNGIVGYHRIALTDKPCIIVGRKGAAGEIHLSKFPCWPIDTTYYVYTPSEVCLEFLFYLLSILKLGSLDKSTAIPGLNRDDAYNMTIPLPPLPEQHRIVNKIEELFTKLDTGVDALKKIKIQLKRYRQAVLKNAFEGKLTQQWREAHKDELEPASVLLEKIKEHRKKEFKRKFKELPLIDTSVLPELPEGWVWTTISQLVAPFKNSIKRGPFGSSIKKAFFTKNGFKVYEQQNAIYDNHKLGNYYISQDKFNELKDFEVKPGDFIISCSGTIGKIALIPEKAERGIINQALLKLTIDKSLVIPVFFLEYFRFEKFQKKLLKETRGSAIKNINSVKDIKSIPFPLPPLPEQHQIVAEIESRISVADQLEKVIEQSLKQAERLRQSILKQAFEGKLAPQDPTDEPAEKLLKRIKEEKDNRSLIKQKSGKRK